MKMYMAVTADKYELPIDFGTSEELSKKFNMPAVTIRTNASRNYNCKNCNYKFISVKIDDKED